MEFFDQFSNPAPLPPLDPDIYIPTEGFTGEHVESLSMLVKRLEAGQFVNELPDGIYTDDQVFDSEYLDPFEVMDRSVMLQESLQTSPSERPQRNQPSQEGETAAHDFRTYRLRN